MPRPAASFAFALWIALSIPAGLLGADAQTTRVACVGDSITFGMGVANRKVNSYPVQLGKILGKDWEVRNFGVNGATMLKKGDKPYWKLKAYKDALAFEPNVVVIKLGTNDTKPQNWKHKADYAKDYAEMIKTFRALPSRPRVYVVLPAPAYPGRWGINDKTIREEVLPLAKQVAKDTGAGVIDAYAALSDKKELFPDAVHPNAKGARLLAETIAKAISSSDAGWPGKASKWHGFAQYTFEREGRKCIVVTPKEPAPGRPWIWRARFFGHEPQADVALLNKGFHIAYIDVSNLYGAPAAVKLWDQFYEYLTKEHDLSAKVALEGMSRGGLIIYNWAKENPEKVSCIYADAPVCDIRSWPGGKGKGPGSDGNWLRCLKAYGITDAESETFQGNPFDGLEPLAKAGVPLLHVCGAEDKVVPVDENTAVLAERYKKLDGSIRVILKPGVGHHPHSLKDPAEIVDFVLRNTTGRDAQTQPHSDQPNGAAKPEANGPQKQHEWRYP